MDKNAVLKSASRKIDASQMDMFDSNFNHKKLRLGDKINVIEHIFNIL
jgi:hypothetical protein